VSPPEDRRGGVALDNSLDAGRHFKPWAARFKKRREDLFEVVDEIRSWREKLAQPQEP
jgi:hypothetical protein